MATDAGGTARLHGALDIPPADTTQAIQALMAVARDLAGHGRWTEAAETFDRAALLADGGELPELGGQALANAGVALHRGGQPHEALQRSTRALEVFSGLGDRVAQGRVETNCAVIHRDLGDLAAALDAARRAERLGGGAEDRVAQVERLGLHAELAAASGQDAEARRQGQAAVTHARELGDPQLRGRHLERLSRLLADQGDATAALAACFEAVTVQRAAGDDPPALYRVTLQLALLYQLLGRWPDALAALTDARAAATRIGNEADLPRLQAGLAATHLALGQPEAGRREAEAAVAGYRAGSDRAGLGRSLVTLGQCVCQRGDRAAARVCWLEAVALLDGVDPDGVRVAGELLDSEPDASPTDA